MPAYHSNFASCQQSVGNFAILPLKTKFRGPANANSSFASDSDDIIDETLNYFKANVFFRTYEIKSEADRVLIYITLYITECLKVLQKCSNKQQGLSMLYNLALSKFDIPGDPNFPLNSVYLKPESPYDADLLKSYLIQLRQETGVRLCDKVFNSDDEKPSTDNPCKHVNVVSTLKLNFQRSTNVDDDDLRALVDSNPCTTVQELAEELGVSKSTISEHLNRIGKSKKLDKWVPY